MAGRDEHARCRTCRGAATRHEPPCGGGFGAWLHDLPDRWLPLWRWSDLPRHEVIPDLGEASAGAA